MWQDDGACGGGPDGGSLSVRTSSVRQGESVQADFRVGAADPTNWVGVCTDPGNGPVDQTFVGEPHRWQYVRAKQLRFLVERAVDVVGFQENDRAAAALGAALGWCHHDDGADVGILSSTGPPPRRCC
ncbi:hypothetical protein [Spirilliplanes yamanashiensis]|uniref:Endonuclease/exonuclease/phosphatase domain-containing protein n=1 Tax=Spirilliplanes yamanashiensis TaxID=42233 RepID=A0A8J4DMR4_9ACTN|nr:hypothetical protein [Spirilliplanes yamanashiensis]MDP9815251.1 hypothetical protein [Spirilliplanes yamanashiensis]GIJ06479.1 hypothetical protein Sya03_58310 [Spirilliplanes yamanashiensis]